MTTITKLQNNGIILNYKDIANLCQKFHVNELSKLLNRSVDLVEKESIKNPIRRNKIFSTSEIIYAKNWLFREYSGKQRKMIYTEDGNNGFNMYTLQKYHWSTSSVDSHFCYAR